MHRYALRNRFCADSVESIVDGFTSIEGIALDGILVRAQLAYPHAPESRLRIARRDGLWINASESLDISGDI